MDLYFNDSSGSDYGCDCRRCLKGDPGGCLSAEAIFFDQLARGIVGPDDYFIMKDENGVPL